MPKYPVPFGITKAILANIFRDYWAAPYQKERIEAKEKYDLKKLEAENLPFIESKINLTLKLFPHILIVAKVNDFSKILLFIMKLYILIWIIIEIYGIIKM